MNSKKRIIMMAVLTLSIGIVGCTTPAPTDTTKDNTEIEVTSSNDQWVEGIGGEVIEIREGEVHVLTGDIVNIFNVTQASLNKIYLGEEVFIRKNAVSDFEVVPSLKSDFSNRYTSMGNAIKTIEGTVKSVIEKDNSQLITIIVDNKEMQTSFYGEFLFEVNKEYLFDVSSFQDSETLIIEAYDPTSIMTMTVENIYREDNGAMTISARDIEDAEYIIAKGQAIVNFNLSELKKGDTIDVYVQALMESYPMQIKTNRINKIIK